MQDWDNEFFGVCAAIMAGLLCISTYKLLTQGVPEELKAAMWILAIATFCLVLFYFAVTNIAVAILVGAAFVAFAINGRNKA